MSMDLVLNHVQFVFIGGQTGGALEIGGSAMSPVGRG